MPTPIKSFSTNHPNFENVHASHHHLVCWKSVIAGVLISLMGFMVLTALGAGIGGLTASHMVNNEEGGTGLATGAGVWLGLSAVISLFFGSYFALRISRFVTNKIGAAHGFVVASVFFIILVMGASSGVGSLSRGLGKMVQGFGETSTNLASSPMVQDTINKAIGGTGNLKSDPKDVAQGLAIRLLQGDTDSAKAFLAYQTGQPAAEVDAKVTQLKADFDQALKVAGEKAAEGVAAAGWSLFVTFLVGLIAALIGGRVGAQANGERPLAADESESFSHAGIVTA